MQRIKKKIHAIAEDSSFFDDATLKRDNIILLISIILFVFIMPIVRIDIIRNWGFDILISVLILSCITSLKFKKEKFIKLSYMSLFTLALVWLNHFIEIPLTKLISFALLTMFLIYITFSMIKHVTISKDVNSIMLLNAINSYLLIGIIGSFLFVSINVVYVNYFDLQDAINFNNIVDPVFHDYVYFSFVTLTTLGFGDITPNIP
ncbi:MAG: hypothetical protein KAI45_11700, partial [Melioribacteraceae bacterium]|nr:hypothetical protein [Melioribacteraceae bacterium]